MMDKNTALEFRTIIVYELMKQKMSTTDYERKVSDELKCSVKTVHRYFIASCGFARKNSGVKYYEFLRASEKYLNITRKELFTKRKLYHELDEKKKEKLFCNEKGEINQDLYTKWIDEPYKRFKEELSFTEVLITYLELVNDSFSEVLGKNIEEISDILQETLDEWQEKIVKETWNKSERDYKEYISFLYNYYEKLKVSKEFLTQILSLQYDRRMKKEVNTILKEAVEASRKHFTNIMNHGLSDDIINLICMQKNFITLEQEKQCIVYDERKGYRYNNLLVINECSTNIKFETVYSCMKLVEITVSSGNRHVLRVKQDCLNKAIAYAMLSKSQQSIVMKKILNVVAQYK